MRRLIAALIAPPAVGAVLVGGALLTACSSSPTPASANQAVTVVGAAGKAPTVKIPAKRASGALVTKTLTPGHGVALAATDSYLANFDVYVWHGATHRLIYSSWTRGPQ